VECGYFDNIHIPPICFLINIFLHILKENIKMSQFLQFQKITTSTQSQRAPIIINKDNIIYMEQENIFDQLTQTNINVSEIYVIGYPEYSFYTPTPFTTIQTTLGTIDATQGIQTGVSSCGLVPGVLDLVKLGGSLPTVKFKRIQNRMSTSTYEYICNPNYILYAEEVGYLDESNGHMATYLNIVLRGNPLRRVPTQLTIAELAMLLDVQVL